MNHSSCESICMAAMALGDGETPSIPIADIQSHLAQCARCTSEVRQLKAATDLLDSQRRREPGESVWDGVAVHLRLRNARRQTSDSWPWLLLLGLSLAGGRIVIALSDWEPGLWTKLAPALLAIAVFYLLRENPFKVNPALQSGT